VSIFPIPTEIRGNLFRSSTTNTTSNIPLLVPIPRRARPRKTTTRSFISRRRISLDPHNSLYDGRGDRSSSSCSARQSDQGSRGGDERIELGGIDVGRWISWDGLLDCESRVSLIVLFTPEQQPDSRPIPPDILPHGKLVGHIPARRFENTYPIRPT
jgi:hypothetical protein